MRITTNGLILNEQTIGENDKLVTVLTSTNGVIRCFAKGAKLIKNRSGAAAQTLSYSRLNIYHGRDKYIIDEAEPIKVFFELRNDIERLALAQYFCELAIHVIPENSPADEFLSLILNSLHILSENKKPPLMIKAVYELRLMSNSGYMPNLVCCDGCKCYEADTMYYCFDDRCLLCQNCYDGRPNVQPLSKGALTAMRYSVFAEPKKIFSFSVSNKSLLQFADCSERILLTITDHYFNSLDFYKKVRTN